jgi:exo beta-1,2-glucooligosaccharide sophorohydrolase (non-reducing end)
MRDRGNLVLRSLILRTFIQVILGGAWSGVFLTQAAYADTRYYQHSFFDNSLTPDAYYYSSGKASAPSVLALVNGKVPVEGKTFLTPPNALRLQWQSAEGGGWEVRVDVMRFRNREIRFRDGILSFWCFSPQALSGSALPLIRIVDTAGNFSGPLQLE